MNLMLDTCTFLWLALPQGKLSEGAVAALDDPASNLFLSEISIWEISLKHSAGKLPLPDSPKKWLPKRLSFFHIKTIPLSLQAISVKFIKVIVKFEFILLYAAHIHNKLFEQIFSGNIT